MNREHSEKCASCAQFPLDTLDADGRAICTIRDEPHHWNTRACVIYDRANDVNRRAPIVKKLMESQP